MQVTLVITCLKSSITLIIIIYATQTTAEKYYVCISHLRKKSKLNKQNQVKFYSMWSMDIIFSMRLALALA